MTITFHLPEPLPKVILLEEQVPDGWTVADISYDGVVLDGKLTWVFANEFGNYPPPSQVTYVLIAKTSEEAVFTGTVAIPEIFEIGGDTETEELCPCFSGDTNCDLRLSVGEAASLLVCWRTGDCGIGLAAKGLSLWIGGECYERTGENQYTNVTCPEKDSQAADELKVAKDSLSSATRSLPDCYGAGQAFEVTISLGLSTPTPQVVLLEDQVPTGWVVSNISNNGTFSAGKVRWSFVDGLGNYPPPAQVSYTLTPQASGAVEFSGTLADPEESLVVGDEIIEECPLTVEFWQEY